MKRGTNVTCNQRKRSQATKTSTAMPLSWLYVVAVAVRHAADCTFAEGALSGTGRETKQPLRSENHKNKLPSTLPLLSNNTVDTDNSLKRKHSSSGSHSDYYYYYCSYYRCSCMNVHYPSFISKGFSFIGDLLLGWAGSHGGLE